MPLFSYLRNLVRFRRAAPVVEEKTYRPLLVENPTLTELSQATPYPPEAAELETKADESDTTSSRKSNNDRGGQASLSSWSRWEGWELRKLMEHVGQHGPGRWERAVPGRSYCATYRQWKIHVAPLIRQINERIEQEGKGKL